MIANTATAAAVMMIQAAFAKSRCRICAGVMTPGCVGVLMWFWINFFFAPLFDFAGVAPYNYSIIIARKINHFVTLQKKNMRENLYFSTCLQCRRGYIKPQTRQHFFACSSSGLFRNRLKNIRFFYFDIYTINHRLQKTVVLCCSRKSLLKTVPIHNRKTTDNHC